MNTNTMELNLNEMEQVNGGFNRIEFTDGQVMSVKGLVYIAKRIRDCATGRA